MPWNPGPASRGMLARHGVESAADRGPLRELGMPVLDIKTDAVPYFDLHHTANDTFDKVDSCG